MYYIYQRISCDKQSLIRQQGAIGDYCKANNIEVPEENIFSDVITGKTIKRENYQKMKSKLQKGDMLLLLSVDRLGRNWEIIKKEWQELTDMGVYITVIDCPIINVMPDENGNISLDKRLIQSIMFELLCYLSQKEVERLSIRTREALKAKREQGIKLGRESKLTDEQRAEILALKGIKTCKEIGEMYGVNASTISRIK
jgi:DNA invertase Pin-like site-specific DNA recombinase